MKKFLKNFCSSIIGILLFILIFLLTFSFVFKKVVQKQIIGETVKSIVVDEYIKNTKLEHKDQIEKLLQDEDADKLIDIIIDEYSNSLDNESYTVDDSTVDTIIDLCVKHKEEISQIAGYNISENDIRSTTTRNNISEAFNEGIKKTNVNIGTTGVHVVKAYTNFISTKFRVIIVLSIILLTIILALINWSLYGWISKLGSSLISSGVFTILTYFALKYILNQAVKNLEFKVSINPNSILIIGIVEVVIGTVMVIINKLLTNKIKEKQDNNIDYSINNTQE